MEGGLRIDPSTGSASDWKLNCKENYNNEASNSIRQYGSLVLF